VNLPVRSEGLLTGLQSQFYLSSFEIGKILFMKLIRRLKIQRVKRVPPIPTMIIVIPNVQLSMMYLLMIDGEAMSPTRTTSPVNEL
jgi:hypothetical protein